MCAKESHSWILGDSPQLFEEFITAGISADQKLKGIVSLIQDTVDSGAEVRISPIHAKNNADHCLCLTRFFMLMLCHHSRIQAEGLKLSASNAAESSSCQLARKAKQLLTNVSTKRLARMISSQTPSFALQDSPSWLLHQKQLKKQPNQKQ